MKKLIFILILLFITTISFSAEYESFCYDKESWKGWDKLVQNNLHNMEIQRLHAIRIGFCKKIEEGTISIEKAAEIFEYLLNTTRSKALIQKELGKEKKKI